MKGREIRQIVPSKCKFLLNSKLICLTPAYVSSIGTAFENKMEWRENEDLSISITMQRIKDIKKIYLEILGEV